MSNDEWWIRFRLRLRLRPDTSLSRFKIDRIHYSMFDVGRSMFDVLVSFQIRLAVFWARGSARVKLKRMTNND